MSGLVRLVMTACLLYGLLRAFPASAESGRITFSGAIVVPTCAAHIETAALAAGNILRGHSFVCGGHPRSATGGRDASAYELSVVHLDAAAATRGPLLRYFAGYLASAHVADAQMVTRTYE